MGIVRIPSIWGILRLAHLKLMHGKSRPGVSPTRTSTCSMKINQLIYHSRKFDRIYCMCYDYEKIRAASLPSEKKKTNEVSRFDSDFILLPGLIKSNARTERNRNLIFFMHVLGWLY